MKEGRGGSRGGMRASERGEEGVWGGMRGKGGRE